MVWRYDPIILNDTLSVGWHREQFARMCGRLAACTDTVTISFVDLYAKCRSPLLREITPAEMTELAGFIGETARAHGLRVTACCEKADLTPCGIERAACIDKARLEKLCGGPLALAPDKNPAGGLRLRAERRHRHVQHLPERLCLLLCQPLAVRCPHGSTPGTIPARRF